MLENIKLFYIFFKLGLFTFGGGYAMIPQIKDLIVEKKKWLSDDEMLEIIAIAESTPGPIAINMATYIGYKRGKVLGSIFATIGVVLPSLIIIYLISLFFDKFINNQYVTYAFMGIKCGVAFLILKAAINMIKKMNKNVISISCLVITVGLMLIFEFFAINVSSIILILVGGIIGILTYVLIEKEKVEK